MLGADVPPRRALAYLDVLWRYRRLILLQLAAVLLITVITVMLLPAWYSSRAVILPPQDAGEFSLSALLSGVKVPGVQLPGTSTPSETYLAVLKSHWIGEHIVRQFDLQRIYKAKMLEDAIKALFLHASIGTTDEGTLFVAVEDHDPRRAASMANAFISYLDQFNREHRSTRGSSTRRFVERRLAETADSLRISEDALADYQRVHKAVGLSPEGSSALESSARLLAERANLAVKLDALRTGMSEDNPVVQEARIQLSALDRQLSRLPSQGVEIARLYRRVKINEQLFALLTAQLEEARITEARDTPTVDVLDVASPASRRARPRRAMIIGTAAVLALVWGGVLAFGLETLGSSNRSR